MLLSIVIPCYRSAHTISKVVEMSMEVIDKIEGLDCEFVLVNDCSPDNTYEAIQALAEKYPNVKGIDLAKNFGQHNAIMAGMHQAQGDYIMGMDDDMQTHPSQIPAFIEKMNEGYDVVFGIYKKRKFGFLKNLTSKIASFIVWHMVERPKGLEASNFWCCRKYVRDEIVQYTGYNLYLQILFYRTTRHIANIEIEHFSREEGSSNYNFKKAFRLFMSFMNYTVIPSDRGGDGHTVFHCRIYRRHCSLYTENDPAGYGCGMEFPDVCHAPVLRNYFPDSGSAGGICGQADPEPE